MFEILLLSQKFPIYHKLLTYLIAIDEFHNWSYGTIRH